MAAGRVIGDNMKSVYRVVEIEGPIRTYICKNNKADKYDIPKNFKNTKDAEKWIEKHIYKGMSHRYEVVEVEE